MFTPPLKPPSGPQYHPERSESPYGSLQGHHYPVSQHLHPTPPTQLPGISDLASQRNPFSFYSNRVLLQCVCTLQSSCYSPRYCCDLFSVSFKPLPEELLPSETFITILFKLINYDSPKLLIPHPTLLLPTPSLPHFFIFYIIWFLFLSPSPECKLYKAERCSVFCSLLNPNIKNNA